MVVSEGACEISAPAGNAIATVDSIPNTACSQVRRLIPISSIRGGGGRILRYAVAGVNLARPRDGDVIRHAVPCGGEKQVAILPKLQHHRLIAGLGHGRAAVLQLRWRHFINCSSEIWGLGKRA